MNFRRVPARPRLRPCAACGRVLPFLARECPTCGTRADGASLRAARALVGRVRSNEETLRAFALVTGVLGGVFFWAGWAFGMKEVFYPVAVVFSVLSMLALWVLFFPFSP